MAELDPVLKKYDELQEAFRKAMVASVEAHGRYQAKLEPIVTALRPGEDLTSQPFDIDEVLALEQEADRTEAEMREARDEWWRFGAEHRAHIMKVRAL